MIQNLSGKVAVVTGAASGIGLAIAERFVAEGMRVVLADIEAPALEAAAAGLRQRGGEVAIRTVDVSVCEQVDALAGFAYDRYGAVHVLCNNAGVVTFGRSWELSLEDWRWVLDVNLWGTIHGVKAFLPRMLAAGEPGHVINTASTAALLPFLNIAPYTASKTAITGISEVMYRELREANAPIGVSVLFPVQTPTRMADAVRNRQPRYGTSPATTMRASDKELTTPAQAADSVVRAIRSDRFWIITHDHFLGAITRRAHAISKGYEVVAPPPI